MFKLPSSFPLEVSFDNSPFLFSVGESFSLIPALLLSLGIFLSISIPLSFIWLSNVPSAPFALSSAFFLSIWFSNLPFFKPSLEPVANPTPPAIPIATFSPAPDINLANPLAALPAPLANSLPILLPAYRPAIIFHALLNPASTPSISSTILGPSITAKETTIIIITSRTPKFLLDIHVVNIKYIFSIKAIQNITANRVNILCTIFFSLCPLATSK